MGLAVMLTVAGGVSSSRAARAEIMNWSRPGSSFDWGAAPRVAYGYSSSPGEGDYAWAVEVHNGQAGVGPLWCSMSSNIFAGNSESAPSFGPASAFDTGFAPAVAALDATHVIEVHQGQTGAGAMWSSIGTVNTSNRTVSWPSATNYDWGFAPTIAANGDSFAEVHQGNVGLSPLWVHLGTLSGGWQGGVELVINSQVVYGVSPSVALIRNQQGLFVVIAYQTGTGPSTLAFVIGTVSGNAIEWKAPAAYDWGYAPSLAASPERVVEVHQGQSASGPLWYHSALFDRGLFVLHWDNVAYQYDSGYAPSVAWSTATNEGVEVHQGAATPASLWERGMTADAAVPFLPQVNGNWCWLTSAEMAIQNSVGGGFLDQSWASTLECEAANLRQQTAIKNDEQVQGWNGGQYIDCCANISSPLCNHTGSVSSVLNDHSCSYNDSGSAASWNTLSNDMFSGRAVPFNIQPTNGVSHYMVVAGVEVDKSGTQWVVVNDPNSEQFAETYSTWASGSYTNYTLTETITDIQSCQN